MMSDYGLDDLNGDNDFQMPDMPDFHWPDIKMPDFSSLSIPDISTLGWVGAGVALLAVAYVAYRKSTGSSILPPKYVPKGKLSLRYNVVGTGIHKIKLGNNSADNGIVAVCQDTGDAYISLGDGDDPNGVWHETIIAKCSKGSDPTKSNSWKPLYYLGGKCYGITVHKKNVIVISSDRGSLWRGATNWRVRNLTKGSVSPVIDSWMGKRTGQFTFLSGKKDSNYADVYFLTAIKEKFHEFGGNVKHTRIKWSDLLNPRKINAGSFSHPQSVPGFVSPRVGSGSKYPYAVQVDVFRDGKNNIHASLGEIVTARIFRFRANDYDSGYERVGSHIGFGIPRGTCKNPGWKVSRGEHFTYGVFTSSLFYMNNKYYVSMSGWCKADGVYIGEVK